jgi:hypothetical protein
VRRARRRGLVDEPQPGQRRLELELGRFAELQREAVKTEHELRPSRQSMNCGPASAAAESSAWAGGRRA